MDFLLTDPRVNPLVKAEYSRNTVLYIKGEVSNIRLKSAISKTFSGSPCLCKKNFSHLILLNKVGRCLHAFTESMQLQIRRKERNQEK